MQIGSIVMFTDEDITKYPEFYHLAQGNKKTLHSLYPDFYPPAKTIGTVIHIDVNINKRNIMVFQIQWPSGSTSLKDRWWCNSNQLIELSSKT